MTSQSASETRSGCTKRARMEPVSRLILKEYRISRAAGCVSDLSEEYELDTDRQAAAVTFELRGCVCLLSREDLHFAGEERSEEPAEYAANFVRGFSRVVFLFHVSGRSRCRFVRGGSARYNVCTTPDTKERKREKKRGRWQKNIGEMSNRKVKRVCCEESSESLECRYGASTAV